MSVYYAQGTYWVEFIQQVMGQASTGTTQLILRFTVLGSVSATDPENYDDPVQQYERTAYLAITERTMQFLPEKLASLGYKGNSLSPLDPEHPQHFSFVGQRGRMYCKHEPGQNGGEMREKWDIARTAGSIDVKPADKRKLRDLDALFAKQVRAAGPKSVGKPNGSPAAQPQIDDSDVPF